MSTQVHRPQHRAGEIVRSIVLWVAAAVGAVTILLFVAGLLWGVRAQVVTSGSMEPAIPTGALILVQETPAADLSVGDVVTVNRPNGAGLVTHRIVSIAEDGVPDGARELTLRGDANDSDDPRTYIVFEAGRLLFSVPALGYVVVWLRSPLGIVALGILAAIVIAVYFLGGWELERDDDSEDIPAV